MGSSKKHKEKDREREHKHKRRHKSRSRSRERKHRKDRDGDRKRRHERSPEEEFHSEQVPVKRERHEEEKSAAASGGGGGGGGGGGDLTLSIEETNKLRMKLGLKPLDTGGVKKEEGEETEYSKREDTHAPASNLANQKKTEKLREKMSNKKDWRNVNKKLGKVKGLGESDSEDDGALSWVKKNRKMQTEKEMAAKRAKALEEMDQEFGVSNLVEEEMGTKKKTEYGAKHLKGLKVGHAEDTFSEGKSVILTLEDKAILDEEAADTLVNVNMVDDSVAKKNVENRKKLAEYQPYDDDEYNENGMYKHKEVLGKYDEEIKGAKKEAFALGSGGRYNAEYEKRMREMYGEQQAKGQTLTLPAPSIAREYYTENEMASFNKVKKKVRKIRKKPKAVSADDLVPLSGKGDGDFGSRARGRGRRHDGEEDLPDTSVDKSTTIVPGLDLVDMEVDDEDPLGHAEILGPEEDLSNVPVEDDAAGLELELFLKKARKLKRNREGDRPERIILENLPIKTEAPPENEEEEEEESEAQANMTLNATSEFCRTLGEIPTYGLAGNREEDEDDLLDFERELVEKRRKQEEEDMEANPGWQSVDIDTRPVDIREEDHAALEEEPLVGTGTAGALLLAKKKGYLEAETYKKSATAPKHTTLEAQNYSIEDKRNDDLDEKYNKKGRDRYGGGITQDFKEKESYRPNVKLDYIDESGRMMNQKEAFRVLSHRFHGKGSGKKKTEKRAKKVEEEMLLKNMSSTDTPLGTVALFQEKQRVEKSPFIVLSGGGKTMTSLSKPT